MLTITVPSRELFNEATSEFLSLDGATLKLEHSLLSLSKWEEKWHVPFLGRAGMKDDRTTEQVIDYIRCMTIVPKDLPPEFYDNLPADIVSQVQEYINDPHTATTFASMGNNGSPKRKETVTAELLYYWMFRLDIPMECQKWHLNRLMTLIQLCDMKDNPKKQKRTAQSLAARRDLNAQRRAQYNTNG